MTKTHHTPGPWKVDDKQLGEWPIFVDGGLIHCVGTAGDKASALLMAASPNLCAALIAARSLCLQNADGISGRKIIEQIDRAIAQALGEIPDSEAA